MNLFVIGWNLPKEHFPMILAELRQMIEVYPQLEPKTLWHRSSLCGTLFMASMHTADQAAAPRCYVLKNDNQVVFYSGLPVDPSGIYSAHRAEVLSAHWDHLTPNLEGYHVIVRSTHNPLRLELLTDFLGMEQVFYRHQNNMWLISNSVQLIAHVSEHSTLDPLGVSLFLSIGWVGADRTLLRDIRVIPGGQHWTWETGDIEPRRCSHFAPANLARQPRQELTMPNLKRLSDELTQLCRSLSQDFDKIKCPLTAGRDSRLLSALLTHAELPAEYYTAGDPYSVDVSIGLLIAKTLDLSYDIIPIKAVDVVGEWDNICWRLIRQNDGLSSLWHIANVLNQPSQINFLDLSLWGSGGEIARGPYSTPYLFLGRHRVADVQRFLTKKRINCFGGLIRQDGVILARDYVNRFVEQYVDEGFSPIDIPDLFYTSQRVGRWGGNNARRLRMVGDLFSPYCSRSFVKAAFAMSALQRYTEPLHYALTRLLKPELHSLPFDKKSWPQQQPVLNLLHLLYGTLEMRNLRGYVRRWTPYMLRRLKRKFVSKPKKPPVYDRLNWFEAKREQIQEICLDQNNSSLWDFIDRPIFKRIMSSRTDSAERYRHIVALYTIATLFYYEADRQEHVTPPIVQG